MAGLSMKDIKLRIKSMESTKQITRAMQMVAASKLRRAQDRVLASRPYFETLRQTVSDVLATGGESTSSAYVVGRAVKKVCYVVIAGDRGLAGGYNNNILKKVWAEMQASGHELCVLPIGKKAVEFFRARGVESLSSAYAVVEDLSVSDCFTMAKELCEGYLTGQFDELYLGWTNFASMLSQYPDTRAVLPLHTEDKDGDGQPEPAASTHTELIYEPSPREVFETIVPEYIGGLIYGALSESAASELAARRNAMDAATKNAEEMISDLSLRYNRARQGAITQEITEIVAGAEH